MEEDLEVVWTDKAIERLSEVYLYLFLNWSETVAISFERKLQSRIRLISIKPFIGPGSESKKGLRKILLSRHNYLLYRLTERQLIILDIIDTRQEPKKAPE